MSKYFCRENFLGRPEAIRDLLKELSDEKNSILGDESEKNDFIEVENHEFIESDKGENEELSFDNKDEEETMLEKQTQEDENMKLKYEAKKVEKIPIFFSHVTNILFTSVKFSSLVKTSQSGHLFLNQATQEQHLEILFILFKDQRTQQKNFTLLLNNLIIFLLLKCWK
ncbi:hypothetical protein AVEN_48932-1 [Araneus ventricosus]|uniref:Uncharacterized protein n=1 Tax=Araneus ventricosus TaxID=182803 RepID=A0A4Y2AGP5_ARAVE|nr:hypothetical protein AVEN_48932-1 [Araneus ventricosus]